MRLPSASTLWLAAICPASHVLSWQRAVTPEMARGTAAHRYLERLPEIGRARALAEVPAQHRALCEQIDPARVPGGEREVAYAYDVDSGEVIWLGHIEHRAYAAPRPGRWIFGTADVVQPGPVVLDYKVSDVPHDVSHLKPAAQSLQLRFLALCAIRVDGPDDCDAAEVGHVRVRSDGYLDMTDRATLGYFDWPVIEQELQRIVAGVERAAAREHPDVSPGGHCALCPAATTCPATRALIHKAAEYLPLPRMQGGQMEIPEPAAAWLFLQRLEAVVGWLREELHRVARAEPIALPGGHVVGEVEERRELLDARTAWTVLRETCGEEAAWRAMRTSKEAVQRVAGRAAGRAALSEIVTRGGSERVVLRVIRAHRPRPQATAWDDDVDDLDFACLVAGPKRSER